MAALPPNPGSALKRKYPIFYGSHSNLPEREVKRRRIKVLDPEGLHVPSDPVRLEDVLIVLYRVRPDGSWLVERELKLSYYLFPQQEDQIFGAPTHYNPLHLYGNIRYWDLLRDMRREAVHFYAHLGGTATEGPGGVNVPDGTFPGWYRVDSEQELRHVLFMASKQPRPCYKHEPVGLPILAFRIYGLAYAPGTFLNTITGVAGGVNATSGGVNTTSGVGGGTSGNPTTTVVPSTQIPVIDQAQPNPGHPTATVVTSSQPPVVDQAPVTDPVPPPPVKEKPPPPPSIITTKPIATKPITQDAQAKQPKQPSPEPEDIQPGGEDDPGNDLAKRFEGKYDTQDVPEIWKEVCIFFGHDLHKTNYDEGIQIPGTKFPLRPHQMEAVYLFLLQSYKLPKGGGGHDGAINAMGTGLGKTVISLAIVAVIRFIELWKDEISNPESQYHHKTDGYMAPQTGFNQECPFGRPFKIQCCCVSGSLSSAIADALRPAPTIIFTPPSVIVQYYQEARGYLKNKITLGKGNKRNFVIPLYYTSDQANKTAPAYGPEAYKQYLVAKGVHVEPHEDENGTNEPLLYTYDKLFQVDQKLHNKLKQNQKDKDSDMHSNKTGKSVDIVAWPATGTKTWRLEYTEKQKKDLHDKHFLVIISSNGTSLSRKGNLANIFQQVFTWPTMQARPYNLLAGNKKDWKAKEDWIYAAKNLKYKVAWCVSPRLVCYDEFHVVKGEKTKIHSILRKWNEAFVGGEFKVLAMSATPIMTKLRDSLSQVLGHILTPIEFNKFDGLARAIDAQILKDSNSTLQGQAKTDLDQNCEECNQILRGVIVRRTINSTFHGKKLFQLPPISIKRWTCNSERAEYDDFINMVNTTRLGFKQLVDEKIADLKEDDEYTETYPDDPKEEEKLLQSKAAALVIRAIDDTTGGPEQSKIKTSYNRALWISQFPGILDLPQERREDPRTWLNMDEMNKVISTKTHTKDGKTWLSLDDYFSAENGDLDINTICSNSAKIELLVNILEVAWQDRSLNRLVPAGPALKKHVVIFTAFPGEAAIIAAYLRRNYSSRCKCEWVKSSTEFNTIFGKEDAPIFPDIPFEEPEEEDEEDEYPLISAVESLVESLDNSPTATSPLSATTPNKDDKEKEFTTSSLGDLEDSPTGSPMSTTTPTSKKDKDKGKAKADVLKQKLQNLKSPKSPKSPKGKSGLPLRPTVIVGTTGVLGTGVDALSKCAYGILFRLPWSETAETQATGRIYRCGQRFDSKWFVLLGRDGPFETIVSERHKRRVDVLTQFVENNGEEIPAPASFGPFNGFPASCYADQ